MTDLPAGCRIYALRRGHGDDSIVICWGASRFGSDPDMEMERAVYRDWQPGCGLACYVEWSPSFGRRHSPKQMKAQRERNMRRRVEMRYPLYADQVISGELKRPYFRLETCERQYDERTEINEAWARRWHEVHPEEKRVYLGKE